MITETMANMTARATCITTLICSSSPVIGDTRLRLFGKIEAPRRSISG